MDNRQNNIKELFTGGKFAIFLMQKNGEATDVTLRVCKCSDDGFLVNRSCFDFSNVADELPEIRKAVTGHDVKIILTGDYLYLLNRFLLAYKQLHYDTDFDTLLDFCTLMKEIATQYKKATNT